MRTQNGLVGIATVPSPRSLATPCPAVDRQRTPWLVVYMHASMYHSYVAQYMQVGGDSA